MEVFESPSIVEEKFRTLARRDSPSRLIFDRFDEKFVRTGSVQDDCEGNSGRKISIRTEEDIILVLLVMVACPTKSWLKLFLETKISQRSLVRILNRDLGMKPYHLQIEQQLTNAYKQACVCAT
ncbi:uncharacterized protein NPIL_108051 [Nephila pilipes]|uniref:Transposase n=1 Tax=Nephila pilipes TaxID=299642 RepID=A0A8X6N9Y4_NEPPI|nr:uncharacterized protein NPIL_108051 [Nephila pilipes]